MKVIAIVSAGIAAGAGLLFLWQAGRESADSPRTRRPPPVVSPGAATTTARREASPRPSEPEARSAAQTTTRRTASMTGKRAEDTLTLPTTGERRLLGAVLGDAGPLHGAQVLILEKGEPISETDTDEHGRFEITFPVPSERAALRILARGYAPFERPLGSPRQPGQEHLGNIRILRGSVLSGSVIDEAGRPVAGVEVGMGLWSGDHGDPRVLERTRTGPDGRFRFANAPRGRITLTTRAESWADQTTEHTHGQGRDARIQLVRASTLRLHVHARGGTPVAGASVHIQPTDRRATPREGKTDADGRVVFENLDAVAWSVRVNQPGYKPSGLTSAAADGIEQAVELVAWPCIEGLVLTHDRKPPPAGTRVVALPGGMRGDVVRIGTGGTPVDADGRFRLCDLRPGSYVVRASGPGFASASSHAVRVSDTGDLDIGAILLLQGGTLALALVSGGHPAANVGVELHRTQPVPAQVWMQSAVPAGTELQRSDARGRVTIENLGAGEVWLILRGESTVPVKTGPFTLREGRRTEPPAIELERGVRVQGRVLKATGAPMPRARILVSGHGSIPQVFADEAGKFTLPPLPYGTYSLQAQARGPGGALESPAQELVLGAGQSVATVELRFD